MIKWIIVLVMIAVFLGFRFLYVPYTVKHSSQFYNFDAMSLPTSPNYYLMCPEKFCSASVKHGISPVFHRTVQSLQEEWQRLMLRQPRVRYLGRNSENNQWLYVQYSFFWNFPDFIHIRFISLGENQSTLMVMSHSLFGHSDFGVNKKRVESWVGQLQGIDKES